MPYPPDGPGLPAPVSDNPFQAIRWPAETLRVPAPRPKFRHRWWVHIVLFVATLYVTTVVGGVHYLSYASEFGRTPGQLLHWSQLFIDPRVLVPGLWYSLTLLGILGAHEFGHYYFCRRYNIDASLPYFIPAPIPLTGTLGAVIRIREAFPNRTVLFDIGVGGPIAGFLVLLPALLLGMSMSEVVAMPTGASVFYLGEPLLFQWVAALNFGTLSDTVTINMHPMVFAAWFGMLATALNLLPFGQLDGGHITYATLRKWSTSISLATVGVAIAMTYNSTSWMFMTLMMVAMLVLLGPRHPRVIWEDEPMPTSRYVVAVLALVIFLLCFTPVPIDTLLDS